MRPSLFLQRTAEKTQITAMSGGTENNNGPPAAAAASSKATSAATETTEKPASRRDSERSMTNGNDQADVVLPPSGLDKVRDIDGVKLFEKRLSLISQSSVVGGETLEDDDGGAQSAGAADHRSAVDAPKKSLVHEVDPLHYRQLVKGLIPIRSSLMRPNIDHSATSVHHRKSVHFSDQSGYHLSDVRSFDKPVRV